MRLFRAIWLWITSVFFLKRPILTHLEHVDYIVEDKSYFALSWKMEHAYQLKIRTAGFISILKVGSAYMVLPENVAEIDIVISGAWKSQRYIIELKQIVIENKIDFPVKTNMDFKAKFNIQSPNLGFSNIKINSFNASILSKKQIKKIINITYPN